jgi:hypothetical protein
VLVRRARVDDGCARDGSCVAARLVKHRDGARVVEFAFVLVADANQKKTLVDEFFGPEYSLVRCARAVACCSARQQSRVQQPADKHFSESLARATIEQRSRIIACATRVCVRVCCVTRGVRASATSPIGCSKF